MPPFDPPEPTFEIDIDDRRVSAWRRRTMLPPPGIVSEDCLEEGPTSRRLADELAMVGDEEPERLRSESARPTDKAPPWWATPHLSE